MRTFVSVAVILTASTLLGCMLTVRAEDVVLANAINETDCADVKVTRGDNGDYEARGCGKVRKYACDRPSGTGASKPAAIAMVGCRPLDPPAH